MSSNKKEYCGLFGIYGDSDAVQKAYFGLYTYSKAPAKATFDWAKYSEM